MNINNLPKKIAIFPLSNTIFFPHTILPLNIFEKKYIQLVGDSMKDQRLFGMVQPKTKQKNNSEVYNVGCLGKIISFDETEDNRFLINLSGIIRFKIKEELSTKKLYREFKVDYSDFINDLSNTKLPKEKNNKTDIIKKIKFFLTKKNYIIKFNELNKLNFDQLIGAICMISPFSIEEKQKLIETIKIEDKLQILDKIIKFNLADNLENKTIQ